MLISLLLAIELRSPAAIPRVPVFEVEKSESKVLLAERFLVVELEQSERELPPDCEVGAFS